METVAPDLEEAGFRVARCNDRKLAKLHGVTNLPGMTVFKAGKGKNFDGDLSDGDGIVELLTNPEALNLPDLIEEVNSKQIQRLINERTFVAVFFCKL